MHIQTDWSRKRRCSCLSLFTLRHRRNGRIMSESTFFAATTNSKEIPRIRKTFFFQKYLWIFCTCFSYSHMHISMNVRQWLDRSILEFENNFCEAQDIPSKNKHKHSNKIVSFPLWLFLLLLKIIIIIYNRRQANIQTLKEKENTELKKKDQQNIFYCIFMKTVFISTKWLHWRMEKYISHCVHKLYIVQWSYRRRLTHYTFRVCLCMLNLQHEILFNFF